MPKKTIGQYSEILRYLTLHTNAKVTDISRDLFLSESTVRRALNALDQKGIVERYHGGAVLADPNAHTSIQQRKETQRTAKDAIGRMAASMVEDGMTLLMMGGTTVHAVCPYLHNKRLTVITSSLPVMNDLAWKENITVVLLGGVLNPSEMEVRGGLMQLALERLRADLMFSGTTGLHPVHGLMIDDPNGMDTYQACMRISDEFIVLADHTKCEHYEGTTVLCPFSKIDRLITDNGISESVREYYNQVIPHLYIAN